MALPLLHLAPRSDIPALRAAFARTGRLQIRDVLTEDSARALLELLGHRTPWGLAWQAGQDGPHMLRQEAVRALDAAGHQAIRQKIDAAVRGDGYAFAYSCYPMLDAYLQTWAPGGLHDQVIEHLNDAPMLDFLRAVTGMDDIIKADAQATLYAPGQFLAMHDDREDAAGRRLAYVLSLCPPGWRPEWGGYLNFYDAEGDVIDGYRPRFNALNIFAVPQPHAVTQVMPAAPVGRFAITGWYRKR